MRTAIFIAACILADAINPDMPASSGETMTFVSMMFCFWLFLDLVKDSK